VPSLIEQYPLPKVGQSVRLHSGRVAKVVTVFKANTVLKMMKESEAIGLATRAQARFGQNWRDVYYHADVMFPSGVMDVIDTAEVAEIFDPT
jgi:hypothetical protein